MKKPIWLFCGEEYYPLGGLQGLAGMFETEAEASDYLRDRANRIGCTAIEWYQIVDVVNGKLLRHYGGGGYGTHGDDWPEGIEVVPVDADADVLVTP